MALTRSEQMSRIRSRDTRPEMAIRSVVHGAGLRFRVHRRISAGGLILRPDLVFGPARVVVFVDGCFWHVCPDHATWPSNNGEWWKAKLLANRARDEQANRVLEKAGWRVVRVWEHEDAKVGAARIIAAVRDATVSRSRSSALADRTEP